MLQADTKQSVHFVTDNDLIPMDYQNQLLYWRDIYRVGNFFIGDLANELCDMAQQKGYLVTEQQIFDAVGRFIGKAGRTIRYYAETAEYFSQDIRQEFDMLPFSHFVTARRLGAASRSVLEYARDYPGISEARLMQLFVHNEEYPKEIVRPEELGPIYEHHSSIEKYQEEMTFWQGATEEDCKEHIEQYVPSNKRLLHAVSDLRQSVYTLRGGIVSGEGNKILDTIEESIAKLLEIIQQTD